MGCRPSKAIPWTMACPADSWRLRSAVRRVTDVTKLSPREAVLKRSAVNRGPQSTRFESMLVFIFKLVYLQFCKKYFAVLRKYRQLGARRA
jgi:hypothetical protein